MTDWDSRMLQMAALTATWSKDPSTKVGAVIADGANRVVSQGYNGLPRGVSDDPAVLANRDEKLRRTIHAEMNAVLFAGRPLTGCTIYVTHPPCARCAAVLIQAGIRRVVTADRELGSHWAAELASSERMLREAGVRLIRLQMPETPREAWVSVLANAPYCRSSLGNPGVFLSDNDCLRISASLGL